MNAREHFAWARERAMEYVEMGDGPMAMASFTSDLAKHKGTEAITTTTYGVMLGEYLEDGVDGVRRFFEELLIKPEDLPDLDGDDATT